MDEDVEASEYTMSISFSKVAMRAIELLHAWIRFSLSQQRVKRVEVLHQARRNRTMGWTGVDERAAGLLS